MDDTPEYTLQKSQVQRLRRLSWMVSIRRTSIIMKTSCKFIVIVTWTELLLASKFHVNSWVCKLLNQRVYFL